jgi:hypothetical protein
MKGMRDINNDIPYFYNNDKNMMVYRQFICII